jgi:hypothetical protein
MALVPGKPFPSTKVRLSAYFLQPSNEGFHLVTVRRDFADGGSGMGNVGRITAIRYGTDEGMMVVGDSNDGGYNYGSVSLFLFRKNGIASLGEIPTSFSDGGAADQPSKETHIDGKVEVGQPQSDLVRVGYSIRRNGKTRQLSVVWRSQSGKFVAVSGSVPKELNF